MAVARSNSSTGTMKVSAIRSLATKAARVAAQICTVVRVPFDSSARWMPSASQSASATAMVGTSPITASLECVPACRPTMSPSVVITPEVRPKLAPLLSACCLCQGSTDFI